MYQQNSEFWNLLGLYLFEQSVCWKKTRLAWIEHIADTNVSESSDEIQYTFKYLCTALPLFEIGMIFKCTDDTTKVYWKNILIRKLPWKSNGTADLNIVTFSLHKISSKYSHYRKVLQHFVRDLALYQFGTSIGCASVVVLYFILALFAFLVTLIINSIPASLLSKMLSMILDIYNYTSDILMHYFTKIVKWVRQCCITKRSSLFSL